MLSCSVCSFETFNVFYFLFENYFLFDNRSREHSPALCFIYFEFLVYFHFVYFPHHFQAQPIPSELTAKLLGNRVAVSPIVTIEPRRRKFHKPISLTIPVPVAAGKGMINQYGGDTPTLRLLCSITGWYSGLRTHTGHSLVQLWSFLLDSVDSFTLSRSSKTCLELKHFGTPFSNPVQLSRTSSHSLRVNVK